MKRYWDPEGKYKDAFLKEYNHWILEISFRQHTLGCFIIFAKRDVEKISELENRELVELKQVMEDIEDALVNKFKPERFNYLQLGNELHHLHFHGIPRYKTNRNFSGKVWVDKTFGHPPVWVKRETDIETVLKIKEMVLKSLA